MCPKPSIPHKVGIEEEKGVPSGAKPQSVLSGAFQDQDHLECLLGCVCKPPSGYMVEKKRGLSHFCDRFGCMTGGIRV